MTAPGVRLTGTVSKGGVPLFGPLSLYLQPGAWTCLLGPSGAGKTTLLRLIAGLDTGLQFDGRISADDEAPLAPRLAFMGQDDFLLPWADVLANVTLGARLRGDPPDLARARDLIARVGLGDHADKRPHELSGGQRQRAALARTLMEGRAVVVLDEPFSALDARTRADMQDLSGRLLSGCTVLLVTHDPLEAARLSHVAWLMEGGQLTALPLPETPPVRDLDAPETLEAQAALFRCLRRAA